MRRSRPAAVRRSPCRRREEDLPLNAVPIARTEYVLKLEGIQLEEQSKAATDQARATGGEKKQVVPPELLEEVFELNMQLEELRAAKKLGEAADEHVVRDLNTAKQNFE